MNIEEFKNLSKEELIDLYEKNGRSMKKVGLVLNKGEDYVRKYYNNRGLTNIRKLLIEKDKENYYKSPKKCLLCGKVIDWENRNNRFCCKSCSASYTNLHKVIKNPEQKALKIKEKRIEFCKTNIPNYSITTEKQRKNTRQHNNLINRNYKDLGLIKLLPGQCFICGEYNCNNLFCKKHNFQQLIGLVKHVNFNPKVIGTNLVFDEFNKIKEEINDLYWGKGLSAVEIGELFNLNNRGPYNLLMHLEIPIRTLSESTTNAIKLGKMNYQSNHSNMFLTENHLTWYNEVVFLRSSYEIDYANYLDNAKIYYEVENLRLEYFDTQQNKTRIAIPDFYLKDLNTIVEIKSDYTLDIQNMLDKVTTYLNLGYKFSLILEHKEVDIFNIDNLLPKDRLDKIRKITFGHNN